MERTSRNYGEAQQVAGRETKGDFVDRYPDQNIILLNVDGYVWLVPYVKTGGVRFLKTIIPSRKATRE